MVPPAERLAPDLVFQFWSPYFVRFTKVITSTETLLGPIPGQVSRQGMHSDSQPTPHKKTITLSFGDLENQSCPANNQRRLLFSLTGPKKIRVGKSKNPKSPKPLRGEPRLSYLITWVWVKINHQTAGFCPWSRLQLVPIDPPLTWLWVKTNGTTFGLGEFTTHFRLPI